MPSDMSPDHELIAALPDGALVVDGGDKIIAANGPVRDALELEVVGLQAAMVLRSSALAAAIASVRKDGSPLTVDIDIHGRPPRQFSAHIAPIGTSGRLLILLKDLTREQRIERMRSDFVANASHELRTPLASISGAIETLQGAAKNDAKARESFLATMLAQAQRMKRLIDDLLSLSRVEMNEHVLPKARVDLSEISKQAGANMAMLAREAKVALVTDAGAPVSVRGNGDELLQVAQNLIENAIKYGGSGGRVEVTCERKGSRGLLSVKDHGPGIAEIHLPRLTERFYRVSTKESRALGGTGLGLAIVKHIVSRHRGRLDIQSAPFEGSTFTVSIPLYESDS
jgi:two-component system phosphate regulon sensor histidine kinase PhoR